MKQAPVPSTDQGGGKRRSSRQSVLFKHFAGLPNRGHVAVRAIEDRGKEGTKKSAKRSGGGAGRGHDHRRDRGAGPGVVVVTEYKTIRTATPISSDRESKPGTGLEDEVRK